MQAYTITITGLHNRPRVAIELDVNGVYLIRQSEGDTAEVCLSRDEALLVAHALQALVATDEPTGARYARMD
jgi:hypothetical protein